MGKILNIGHRGAKGHVAENTLAAFQKALDLGADGVELDVHVTTDGEAVVIHDETLDRTTNGRGLVDACSLAELKKLKVENGHAIPTLSEVFDLIDRKCLINVELKGKETELPVVNLIEKYVSEKNWQYTDFVVSSFDWNALQDAHHLHPKIPLGVLTVTDLDLAIGFAEFINAYSIHPYFHLLTKEKTMAMQQKGFRVFPWTVNETEDLEKIKSFAVDGIITDFPDRL
jgi:glycerophosphoryl diester phosphodiesterase